MYNTDIYDKKKKYGINIINNRDKKIKNYVAIFDIDSTILDENILINPIYELYNYAIENNIYTVFITAREGNKETMKYTLDQLKFFNIKNYDLLYFRPYHMKDIKEYKLYARKNVSDNGYIPLFSIGDMEWDVGQYGGIPIHIF
jgi:hypothetical protein